MYLRLASLTVLLYHSFPVFSYTDDMVFSHYNFPLFSHGSRIIGGRPPLPGEIPFQLQLRIQKPDRLCGSTLVMSPRSDTHMAITAAYCVMDATTGLTYAAKEIEVKAGIVGLNEKGQGLPLQKIMVHPNYSLEGEPMNDIAVLILDGQFSLDSTIRPLKLPERGLPTADMVIVSGWGSTNKSDPDARADHLHVVELPIVDPSTCSSWYKKGGSTQRIVDTNFCAGTENGRKNGCSGDRGGPAVGVTEGKLHLAGVVSWGQNGCDKLPSVFTRVSSYIDWITEVSP